MIYTVEDGGRVLAASPDPEAIEAAARLLGVPLIPPRLQLGLAAVRTLSDAGLRWHDVAELGRQVREQQPPKLRCVIAGSRGITSLDVVRAAVMGAPFLDRVGTIGSGGARGVDTLAGVVAAELGLPFVEMLADWDQHGKRAGYLRNAEMAVWAKETPPGALVAAWDGFSRGTRHMIDLAKEHGLLVHIVIPAEPIVLSEGEMTRLVEILENPPPPNEALRRAMSTFDGKIRPTRRKP